MLVLVLVPVLVLMLMLVLHSRLTPSLVPVRARARARARAPVDLSSAPLRTQPLTLPFARWRHQVRTEMNPSSDFPWAEEWGVTAAPFILNLQDSPAAEDFNGTSMVRRRSYSHSQALACLLLWPEASDPPNQSALFGL